MRGSAKPIRATPEYGRGTGIPNPIDVHVLISSAYAERRSTLAKQFGLGNSRRRRNATTP